MDTLDEQLEKYKFEEKLKGFCEQLFFAKFCPHVIKIHHRVFLYAGIRYILIMYEIDDVNGYMCKCWMLRGQRCDKYGVTIKHTNQSGYFLEFTDFSTYTLFDTRTHDWKFQYAFHRISGKKSKNLFVVIQDILKEMGVLVSPSFVCLQQQLNKSYLHFALSGNGQKMVLNV